MKKTLTIVAAVLLLASCGRTQSGVTGGLYTSWQDTIPGSINNSVAVSKRGEACATNILGVVALGNSSIEEAKKAGKIRNVAFADTNYLSILGVYQKGCTVVKGE